jgi:serine/threonine protein kinase
MSQIDRGTLTLGRRLGHGGQGAVCAVANRTINQNWDVVYKEYNPGTLPHVQVNALTAMADLVSALPRPAGEWLCERTSWPAAVVESNGQVTGFLMRAVPDRFRFDLQNLSAAGGASKKLATLEFLLNDDAYVAQIGLLISERDRLLLLADIAATLSRLHSMNITVGDLSPKNLLFATTPAPECFLIDCDAMRLADMDVLPQVETPDWQVPAGERKGTRHSDAYKFALLAIRMFARDQAATDPAALAAVDTTLGDLARAGTATDPDQRPSPAEWAEHLTAAAQAAPTTPAQAPQRPRTIHRPATWTPGKTLPSQQNLGNVAAVAAVIIALLVVAVLRNSHHDPSDPPSLSPAGVSTPQVPDFTPDTDPATTVPEPDLTTSVPEPDPTTTAPEPVPPAQYQPPPPPPPPAPKHYGAIAVAHDGSTGRAWDFGTAAAARQRALNECPRVDCKVLTNFVNGCGAVAYNPNTNRYWGGRGDTQLEAENDAISNAGGGHWITWVCTTR